MTLFAPAVGCLIEFFRIDLRRQALALATQMLLVAVSLVWLAIADTTVVPAQLPLGLLGMAWGVGNAIRANLSLVAPRKICGLVFGISGCMLNLGPAIVPELGALLDSRVKLIICLGGF